MEIQFLDVWRALWILIGGASFVHVFLIGNFITEARQYQKLTVVFTGAFSVMLVASCIKENFFLGIVAMTGMAAGNLVIALSAFFSGIYVSEMFKRAAAVRRRWWSLVRAEQISPSADLRDILSDSGLNELESMERKWKRERIV